MKRFSLLICSLFLFACHKQATAVVYDSHLFTELNNRTWIFDSNKIVRAGNSDTTVYTSDTAEQTATFLAGQYIVKTVADTTVLDSVVYQTIYDDPNIIYYYDNGGQFLLQQYFTIDTINASKLILKQSDTTSNLSSLIFYHAQ